MRQQKYTQTQQVIDTLRTTGGYATLGDLYHLVDTKSWATKTPNESIYQSEKRDFVLAHGDCFKLLKEFDFKFDMIFADPPYFLSNGGISLQSGKVVCVNKGNWDKGKSQEDMMAFNMEWLRLCRDKLKDNSFNMFRCKEWCIQAWTRNKRGCTLWWCFKNKVSCSQWVYYSLCWNTST